MSFSIIIILPCQSSKLIDITVLPHPSMPLTCLVRHFQRHHKTLAWASVCGVIFWAQLSHRIDPVFCGTIPKCSNKANAFFCWPSSSLHDPNYAPNSNKLHLLSSKKDSTQLRFSIFMTIITSDATNDA